MSHHNKKLYEAVFENRPIMKCDLQLLVVEIRQVLEGYSNVTCRKSSDDNESMQRINTSLILENIEVLKMIFSKEIYKEHSIRLFEEEIASLLLVRFSNVTLYHSHDIQMYNVQQLIQYTVYILVNTILIFTSDAKFVLTAKFLY